MGLEELDWTEDYICLKQYYNEKAKTLQQYSLAKAENVNKEIFE